MKANPNSSHVFFHYALLTGATILLDFEHTIPPPLYSAYCEFSMNLHLLIVRWELLIRKSPPHLYSDKNYHLKV